MIDDIYSMERIKYRDFYKTKDIDVLFLGASHIYKGIDTAYISDKCNADIWQMITWVLTGLWHGTGAGYVAWGLYYGILITISTLFSDTFNKITAFLHIKTENFSFKLFQMIRTFLLFAGGRLLTKGSRFKDAVIIVRKIVKEFHWEIFLDREAIYTYGLNYHNMFYIYNSIILLIAVSVLQLKYNIRNKLEEQNLIFRWLILIAGLFLIFFYGVYGSEYSTEGFAYQIF